jgi:hypothetical protein
MDHLDRIVASTARPEPVLLAVQPGFPFWFQCVTHPLLLGAVGDNWNPEWAFPAFFGVG